MGQTASQIESHIEDKREDLTSNLRELENRVKSVTDWKHQFEQRPMLFLGAAFGGGIALAAMTAGSSSSSSSDRQYSSSGSSARVNSTPSPAMQKVSQAWDNISAALVGVATSKVKEYVDNYVPGFSQQYQKVETQYR